jgi:hypothetical protein
LIRIAPATRAIVIRRRRDWCLLSLTGAVTQALTRTRRLIAALARLGALSGAVARGRVAALRAINPRLCTTIAAARSLIALMHHRAVTALLTGTRTQRTPLALAHATAIAKPRCSLLTPPAPVTRTQCTPLALAPATAIAKPRCSLLTPPPSITRTQRTPLARSIDKARTVAQSLSIAEGARSRPVAVVPTIDTGPEAFILHHQPVARSGRRLGLWWALGRRRCRQGARREKSCQGSHGDGQLHHGCTPSERVC